MNRRDFLNLAAAAGALGAAGGTSGKCCCEKKGKMLFGACAGMDLKTIQDMKEIGYDFFESGVAAAFIPKENNEKWKAQKEKILSAALPIRSCNGFLPGEFRLTGPEDALTWEAALKYAETACRRADEVGLKTIVFGSSGARNVPCAFLAGGKREGFKVEDGRDQFVEFNRKLAERISDCKVQIVIEPLCPNESNIFNYVWQGMVLVREVKSPRIQELADLYHMSAGWEDRRSLTEAGCHLKHCHIAMPKTRLAPGLSEPGVVVDYMKTLAAMGYEGGVSIEASWTRKGEKRPDAAEMHNRRVKALACMKEWAGQA